MTILNKKLATTLFIISLATASMASDHDDDSEEELSRQLMTLKLQNKELENKKEKELRKEQIRQQIEEEKQKTLILSNQSYEPFSDIDPIESFKDTLTNTVAVGLNSLHEKATGTDNPNAPSKWVPEREKLKQSGMNLLFSFLNNKTN